MVERAKQTANFKLVILKGKAYLETYEKAYQTRDVFSIWLIVTMGLILSNHHHCFGIVAMMLLWILFSLIGPSGDGKPLKPTPLFQFVVLFNVSI